MSDSYIRTKQTKGVSDAEFRRRATPEPIPQKDRGPAAAQRLAGFPLICDIKPPNSFSEDDTVVARYSDKRVQSAMQDAKASAPKGPSDVMLGGLLIPGRRS